MIRLRSKWHYNNKVFNKNLSLKIKLKNALQFKWLKTTQKFMWQHRLFRTNNTYIRSNTNNKSTTLIMLIKSKQPQNRSFRLSIDKPLNQKPILITNSKPVIEKVLLQKFQLTLKFSNQSQKHLLIIPPFSFHKSTTHRLPLCLLRKKAKINPWRSLITLKLSNINKKSLIFQQNCLIFNKPINTSLTPDNLQRRKRSKQLRPKQKSKSKKWFLRQLNPSIQIMLSTMKLISMLLVLKAPSKKQRLSRAAKCMWWKIKIWQKQAINGKSRTNQLLSSQNSSISNMQKLQFIQKNLLLKQKSNKTIKM